MGLDYCHRMGVANRDIKLENTLLDGSKPRPLVKLCDFGYSKHIDDSRPKTKVGTPGYTAPEVVRAAASSTYDGPAADVWSAGVRKKNLFFCFFFFHFLFTSSGATPRVVATKVKLIISLSLSLSFSVFFSFHKKTQVMLYTMVFCAYPFERPGDGEPNAGGGGGDNRAKNANPGFQAVLERILKVEYEFPSRKPVSDELKDLISKILVADPKQRATLAEVSAHPWFQRGLPAGAGSMNDACLALRPHDHPGYQTVEAIRSVVAAAARRDQREGDDDAIIEDALDDDSGVGGERTTTTTSGSVGGSSGGSGVGGSGGGGDGGAAGGGGGGDNSGAGAHNGNSSEGTLALDSEGPGRRSSFLEA